jgi:hypothetical protein
MASAAACGAVSSLDGSPGYDKLDAACSLYADEWHRGLLDEVIAVLSHGCLVSQQHARPSHACGPCEVPTQIGWGAGWSAPVHGCQGCRLHGAATVQSHQCAAVDSGAARQAGSCAAECPRHRRAAGAGDRRRCGSSVQGTRWDGHECVHGSPSLQACSLSVATL